MKKMGYQVLTEHIGDINISDYGESKLSPYTILDRDICWIEESDIMVAETTQPSLGVGYELAYAEKLNKSVLILHRNHESHLSSMISGTYHFNNINYYSNFNEAKKILNSRLKL